jgi:hypothetical protein
MLCDKCHTKEATVHISTVVHPGLHQDERHLCPECAEVVQTSDPLLNPGTEPLLTAGSKPVMSLSPEAKAKIEVVNDKLSELDPIIHAFCTRRGYAFRAFTELWPARRATAHGDICRCLHLTTDASFLDILKRGFYPQMPWSLCASATLPLAPGQPIRTLFEDVFRSLPFSELASLLEERLENGFSILRELTREDVLAKGEMPGGRFVRHRWLPPVDNPER